MRVVQFACVCRVLDKDGQTRNYNEREPGKKRKTNWKPGVGLFFSRKGGYRGFPDFLHGELSTVMQSMSSSMDPSRQEPASIGGFR